MAIAPLGVFPRILSSPSSSQSLPLSFEAKDHFTRQSDKPQRAHCSQTAKSQKKGLITLEQIVSRLIKLDGAKRFAPDSLTNRFYRECYPREWGVIIYGSAQILPGTPEYDFAKQVGAAIGKQQIDQKQLYVVTGGGPGAMRAAAEGAQSVGAHTVGAAMAFIGEIPSHEVHPEFVIHPDFSSRIDGEGGYEQRAAYTAVVPGGIGTEQELIKKAVELLYDKTPYPSQKQIVLFDYDNFFSAPGGLLDHMRYLVERKKANPKLLALFKIAKTPEEGAKFLLDPKIAWTPGILSTKRRKFKEWKTLSNRSGQVA
jgi:predicted Rossmann-fold nucleotide-binding protein